MNLHEEMDKLAYLIAQRAQRRLGTPVRLHLVPERRRLEDQALQLAGTPPSKSSLIEMKRYRTHRD